MCGDDDGEREGCGAGGEEGKWGKDMSYVIGVKVGA
jgi:hypothetical protein